MQVTAKQSTLQSPVVRHNDLVALAGFEDRKGEAISFYFSTPSVSNKAHLEQLTAIKWLGRSIVSSHLETYSRSKGLPADLDAILERAEGLHREALGFKAIFACRNEGVWQEFDLPMRTDIGLLKTGRHFHLVPLLLAMELCRDYCVVLVEHGRARGFVARGMSIQEIPGCLSQRDLHLHADDSRVGWSHHIAGDQQQHARAYLQELAREIERFLVAQGCKDLVIGCREDLWSEIESCWVDRAMNSVRGHFHQPGFAAAAGDILRAAQPVFDVYRQKRNADLLGAVHERSGRGAEGVSAVLEDLQEGRVHTLLLGPLSDETFFECKHCASVTVHGVHSCPSCSSTDLEIVNAQEVLVRKALLTGAEIVAMDALDASVTGGAAALLRY